MKGAIIGDIVGSVYEWHNIKTKDFPLFRDDSDFTDDTVMTCAVAFALMEENGEMEHLADAVKKHLQSFGRSYPHRGYGHHFRKWIYDAHPQPYNSYGNGAPMRVSAAGYFGKSAAEAYRLGEATASPTHNHEESFKAAGLTAELIWRARHGESMESLKKRAEELYNLPVLDEIRDQYHFDVSCMGTMPVALSAFFESNSFVDAIRNAISIGGDSDTIAAITGSIAESYWGVPEMIWDQAKVYLDDELQEIVEAFYEIIENVRE